MKIRITLEALQDAEETSAPLTLNLQCEDTPLAKKWFYQLREILRKRIYLEKHYFQMGFPNASRGLKEISQDLNRCIHIINDYSWDEPYQITQKADESMEQERLNAIHYHFETMMGQTWAPSPWFEKADQKTRVAIMFLNHYIHEFEYKKRSLEDQGKWGQGRATSSLNFAFSGAPHHDLNDEDFHFFNLEKTFGDVFLHYTQLGKTFEEAFFDRDEIVGEDNINGHRYYTGEFDLYLGPNNTAQYYDEYRNRLFKWLREKGFDPDDPRLCLGEAKVASLRPSRAQSSWDVATFQNEIGKRPNVTKIEMGSFFKKERFEFTYSPKSSMDMMIKYFDTGSWS